MNKKLFNLTSRLSLLPVLLAPGAVMAAPVRGIDNADDPFNAIGGQITGGVGNAELPKVIGNVIDVVLGTAAIILVATFFYAGFLYFTAQDSEDKTEKAKTIMKNTVIGLVLVMASFAIARFVIQQVLGVTSNP
jgi:hypothetical protein